MASSVIEDNCRARQAFREVECSDGGKIRDGSIGCGIVIKAADKKNWITIILTAVPFKACPAMAAEITGVSVCT